MKDNELRSLSFELVLKKTDSFLAKSALETHCFVLGGNEFRLRGLVCDAKRDAVPVIALPKKYYAKIKQVVTIFY